MSIERFSRETFELELNKALSPAQPVDSAEHLHGREQELDAVQKALAISGRHAFIYGDRGVGKSSLAATAANLIQSSDKPYIGVSGSPDETFSSLIRNIAYRVSERSDLAVKQRISELGVVVSGITSKFSETESARPIETELTVADATRILQEIASSYSNHTVVVIDEFDQVPNAEDRQRFAHLLKHLGDANIENLRFIFTGIAQSIEDILGEHRSAIRQLHTLELHRLSYEGCFDIATSAATAFGLSLPRDIYIRIAQLSDGFPYYVHLIMEKILWECFDSDSAVSKIDWDIYDNGLQMAVKSVAAELKRPYELVQRHPNSYEYEVVLWATANGGRPYEAFSTFFYSYQVIAEELKIDPMNREQFRRRINNLMKDNLGKILQRDPIHPKQFYVYSEKMFRGYVRMQAESHGIELTGATGPEKKEVWQSVRSSPRYQKSQQPTGWRR